MCFVNRVKVHILSTHTVYLGACFACVRLFGHYNVVHWPGRVDLQTNSFRCRAAYHEDRA